MIDLGRDFNWDKAIDKTLWKELQNHNLTLRYGLQSLDLSMMALAIGFKHKTPKPFEKNSIGSGGNIRDALGTDRRKKNAIGFILSVAVEHTGSLEILKEDGPKIRKISEEYANGGVEKLHQIFMSPSSDNVVINNLLKIMKES